MPYRRILGATLLLAANLAFAQSPPARGINGGQVAVSDGHPIELVVAGTEVTLFLSSENGRPSPSRGASGRVVVQVAGQAASLTLRPAEPNRLVGTLPAPAGAGTRIVFTGVMADGHRVQARYVLE